ncbi:UNVERIFIED_CONTAM: hypothetical protein PYX00_005539 [Menopon gallinae]|uniref:TdIF1 C-terminal domain-containing protein n=1 Tax=Menopon gallinae TaxID=328185 RepID=A0AAW2HT94_9NEOP
MVIQRGNLAWGTTDFSTTELHIPEDSSATNGTTTVSESGDSWESQQTISVKTEPANLVEWKNTFHMRQMTLSNLSSSNGQVRQTLSAQAAGTKLRGRYMTSASKSLDLLRLNIQTLINKEIDAVLKKYLDSPLSILNNKRKESDTDSDASQSIVKTRKKSVRTVSNVISGVPAPLKVMKLDSNRRDGPKWDPNRIVKSTLFIMGARANKVLGFGQTRGRLYTKHPELLKYSGDTEDKEWLSRHNLMPPTGGIAYLLLLEDVKELAESEEYRHNPNILLKDLKGFEAPEFMLKKIRAFVSQARNESKEQINLTYYNDLNDNGNTGHGAMDCASVIMTPPATILGSAPGTPCESLDFMDCPSGLLTSAQANDYLSSSQNFVYDSIVYCDGNKSNQTLLYSSTTSMSNNSIINVNSHSGLASLLMSPIDSDNSQELFE